MCDLVPIGLPSSEQNLQNPQGPLNLPTKVGIQMQILPRHASRESNFWRGSCVFVHVFEDYV